VFFVLFFPHREHENFSVLMKDIHFCIVYPGLELSIASSKMLSLL
jgi:hypothetical protein